MENFIERIRKHAVFPELENCQRSLLKAEEVAAATVEREPLGRVKAVVDFALSALQQSDPIYLTPTILENIRAPFKGVRGELNNYANSKNPAHIQEANNKCDQLLPTLFALPVPFKQTGLDRYVATAEDFWNASQGQLQQMAKRVDELNNASEALLNAHKGTEAEISQQKGRLDNVVAQFQSQFSDFMSTKQTEFASSEQTRLSTHQTSTQHQEKMYEDLRTGLSEEMRLLAAKMTEEASSTNEQLKSAADNDLQTINKLKEQAEKIVGLISEHGMVKGYQIQADKAAKYDWWWARCAVATLVVWIGFSVYAFATTLREPLTWSIIARQFLVSIPFLLLATFLGYQAYIHQRQSTRMRRRELEIASLDPFLSRMSEGDQNAIKKAMVEKFFGQTDAEIPPPPNFTASFLDAVKEFRETAQMLTEKLKR